MGAFLSSIAPYLFYVFGFVALIVSLFKVEYGLMFLIPILPLQTLLDSMQKYPFGKDFVDILLGAMLIGWFLRSMSKGGKFVKGNSVNAPIIIMIFYTLFSLYQGFDYLGYSAGFNFGDDRVQTWKNYILLPIIYFLTANNIKEKKHIRWFTYIMIFVMFVMSVKFFREYRWTDKSFYRDAMRQVGSFSYLGPNEYASFFSHYTFIIIGLLLCVKSKLKKLLFLLPIGFNFYAIIFLFSRGSYLAVLGASVLTGIVKKNILILAFIGILFASWQTILPGSVVQRIENTKNEETGELDLSNEKRIQVWNQSMDLFSGNPVTGIGFNTFPYLGFVLGDSHNLYVKILLEQGVIGLAIFFAIIGFAFMNGWKLFTKSKDDFFKGLGLGFCMCIISLLISNFFGDRWTYQPLGAYFWAFLGMVVAAQGIENSEKNGKRVNGTSVSRRKRLSEENDKN